MLRFVVLCNTDDTINVESKARRGMGNIHQLTVITDALVISGFGHVMVITFGSIVPTTIFVCECKGTGTTRDDRNGVVRWKEAFASVLEHPKPPVVKHLVNHSYFLASFE